jgi:hypothetical protein
MTRDSAYIIAEIIRIDCAVYTVIRCCLRMLPLHATMQPLERVAESDRSNG